MTEFGKTIISELTQIFTDYPINPNHIDIGETSDAVKEWAVDAVLNHHPYLLQEEFYASIAENNAKKERYRKLLKAFGIELFWQANDRYSSLIEGDHYLEEFENAAEENTHAAMKEVAKILTKYCQLVNNKK